MMKEPKWVGKRYDKSRVILKVELTVWHRIHKHKRYLIAHTKRRIRELSWANVKVKNVITDWDEQELKYDPIKGWPKI